MRRRRGTHVAAAFVLACVTALAAACSGGTPDASGSPSRSPAGPATSAPRPSSQRPSSQRPSSPPPPRPLSCADQVFASMTEAQRVGQLFLVGLAGDTAGPAVASEVATYHFGSFLFGGDSSAGVASTQAMTSSLQSLASAQATAHVRFLVAANQEGGQVQQLQGPGFSAIPSAVAQGLLQPGVLQQQAAGWGAELRAAGVNLDLAPVMDVVPAGTAAENQPIGVLQREFGSDPATVAAHGVAFLRGMRQAGVASTVKHFPGLGRVRGNTDFTSDVVDTVTSADDPYLQTYRAAIQAGTPFVMVALATYTRIDPGHLAVFSTRVIGVMLRQELRFQGVVVSDDLGVAAAVASIPPATRATGFLNAGGDLIISETASAAEQMDTAVLAQADADPAFRGVVNAAVKHVLAAKQASGLLPCAAG